MRGKASGISLDLGLPTQPRFALCSSLRCSTSVCIRLLEEEATKRAELEQLHLHQQRTISETEAEKQELEKERVAKEKALQAAMEQLEHLEKERQGALEQYQVRLHPPATRCHCRAAQ